MACQLVLGTDMDIVTEDRRADVWFCRRRLLRFTAAIPPVSFRTHFSVLSDLTFHGCGYCRRVGRKDLAFSHRAKVVGEWLQKNAGNVCRSTTLGCKQHRFGIVHNFDWRHFLSYHRERLVHYPNSTEENSQCT